MRSPYQILGVKRSATADEIKSAYRRRAKKIHPDHGGDADKFKELVLAYSILSDPTKRREWDTHSVPRPSHHRHQPPNPQPRTPPPTPTEQAVMIQQLATVGIGLVFGEMSAHFPGPLGDTLRQAGDKAKTQAESLIESLLRSRQ